MARVEVLLSDEHLAAVSKPSGLFVHRTNLAPDRDVLLQRVRDHFGRRVNAVHRIDRATSGVVIFAFDPVTTAGCAQALAAGTKTYVGLVRGVVEPRGVFDRPLGHPDTRVPQDARTEFERVGVVAQRHSLVRFSLKTGRRHQIRRHLNHAGHHLIGDTRYGKGGINRWFRSTYELPRMALHAERVIFEHPRTGQRLDVRAPLPDDLEGFFGRLPGFDPSWLD